MANYSVIINEQHSLMDTQKEILPEGYKEIKIPAKGMTLDEMKDFVSYWGVDSIPIFISPIPALMALMANNGIYFMVFHNDNREKKELPNGKVIMTVAKEGWVLV